MHFMQHRISRKDEWQEGILRDTKEDKVWGETPPAVRSKCTFIRHIRRRIGRVWRLFPSTNDLDVLEGGTKDRPRSICQHFKSLPDEVQIPFVKVAMIVAVIVDNTQSAAAIVKITG
jgi:hypothetical protein